MRTVEIPREAWVHKLNEFSAPSSALNLRSTTSSETHMIHAVTRIYIERTDDGADAALEIESVDGTTTILRFRVAALPETVDGIVRRCALPSC